MSKAQLELGLLPAKKVRDTGTVAQGNFLIRSHITFDSVEAKLFTYMLAGIDKEDKEFRQIEFPLSKITTNRGGSGYDQVKKACEGLMEKRIDIPSSNKRGSFHFYPVIADIGLDAGTGLISGTFHPMVKPYLIDLKENYTISEIEKLLSLKSGYAHRLFWYLKSYENMKSRFRAESWEEFKNIMLGVDSTSYRQNTDFKRFVFEPAFKQVIESGAFHKSEAEPEPTVSYSYQTRGKRIITGVRFDFANSPHAQAIAEKAKGKAATPGQSTVKYKPTVMAKQSLKATSRLTVEELKEMHQGDFDNAVAERLKGGWYWNENKSVLLRD